MHALDIVVIAFSLLTLLDVVTEFFSEKEFRSVRKYVLLLRSIFSIAAFFTAWFHVTIISTALIIVGLAINAAKAEDKQRMYEMWYQGHSSVLQGQHISLFDVLTWRGLLKIASQKGAKTAALIPAGFFLVGLIVVGFILRLQLYKWLGFGSKLSFPFSFNIGGIAVGTLITYHIYYARFKKIVQKD